VSAELDIAVLNAGTVHTMRGPVPRRGREMLDTGAVRGAAVGVKDGRIAYVGPEDGLEAAGFRIGPRTEVLDAAGGDVIPGFVDSHTHLIWLGDRRGEFAEMLKGRSYADITAAGGGINTTVRGTRHAALEELESAGFERAMRMLAHGTTALEAKSGYALETEGELKMLEAAARVAARTPQIVEHTFLGAHLVPYDYRGRKAEYVRLVVEEMLPRAAEQGIARFNDVFLEFNAFDREETRLILEEGKKLGLIPKLHADELSDMDGAALAVELGAASCDHLEYTNEEGMRALARSDTVATLMPGTSFFLNLPSHAPFGKFYEHGCAVALATDFNPGTSPSLTMQGAFALGVLALRMPVEAALCAATVNGAFSLRIHDRTGSIEPGKRADLVVLGGSVTDVAYHWGENHARYVVCGGRKAAEGGRIVLQ